MKKFVKLFVLGSIVAGAALFGACNAFGTNRNTPSPSPNSLVNPMTDPYNHGNTGNTGNTGISPNSGNTGITPNSGNTGITPNNGQFPNDGMPNGQFPGRVRNGRTHRNNPAHPRTQVNY